MEPTLSRTERKSLDSSNMASATDTARKSTQMVESISVNSKTILRTVKESSSGAIERSQVSGETPN